MTGIDLTLANGIEPQYAIFDRSAKAVSWGRSTLTGTLSAFYVDGNLPGMFINDSRVKLEFTFERGEYSYTFLIPSITLTGADDSVQSEGRSSLMSRGPPRLTRPSAPTSRSPAPCPPNPARKPSPLYKDRTMTKATESAAVETALVAPFDFTTRDVAKKAEEGAELEVLDPVTNEPWAFSSPLPVPIPPFTARPRPQSPSAA